MKFKHEKSVHDLIMQLSDLFEGENLHDAATACSVTMALLLKAAFKEIPERKAALEEVLTIMAQITLDEDEEYELTN
jgi:hypothetical protein